VLDRKAVVQERKRVEHTLGAIKKYLSKYPEGTPVALESVGNWYWIVDEIEEAGCRPLLTDAGKAKLMMGNINKTDKLDADGLALLLHNRTLPRVWIPSGELRDLRELPRTRMALTKQRTAIKNRVHAALARYGIRVEGSSDIFVGKGRVALEKELFGLPEETRCCVNLELELLDQLREHIRYLEKRIRDRIRQTQDMQLLKSLPGVGDILAIVISNEMGSVDRFPDAEHFASYAGTTPKVKSSGGKTYYGHLRKESNQYLKWAFIEAANVIVTCRFRKGWKKKHVVRLYQRIRRRKGHGKAVGAVARHLAEASYWMLRKKETYQDPTHRKTLPKQG
jgi:transposase